jgi:hypothetical protein
VAQSRPTSLAASRKMLRKLSMARDIGAEFFNLRRAKEIWKGKWRYNKAP